MNAQCTGSAQKAGTSRMELSATRSRQPARLHSQETSVRCNVAQTHREGGGTGGSHGGWVQCQSSCYAVLTQTLARSTNLDIITVTV